MPLNKQKQRDPSPFEPNRKGFDLCLRDLIDIKEHHIFFKHNETISLKSKGFDSLKINKSREILLR